MGVIQYKVWRLDLFFLFGVWEGQPSF